MCRKITRQQPGPKGQAPRHITHTQRIELVRETRSLWTKGSAYPPPGDHFLKLPFQFTLPPNLLPSCHYEGFHWEGTVGYFLEAVGERHGLHFNRRQLASFPLLPVDIQGAGLRSALSGGWSGSWRAIEQKDEIRRGIWGDYSHVQATVSVSKTATAYVLIWRSSACITRYPCFPSPHTDPLQLKYRHNHEGNQAR